MFMGQLSTLLTCLFALALCAPSGAAAAEACSDGTVATSFAAEATSGAVGPGESDCLTLSNLTTGDQVSVSTNASAVSGANPGWAILGAGGSTACGSWVGAVDYPCTLTGSGPWSLVVSDQSGSDTGAFSYSVAVRRLSSPQGCSNLGEPSTWSFSDPRQNGSIGGALGAHCYTFTRGEDEADSRYWFRTVRTSGELQPRWTVYGPSGAQECSGSSGGPASACQLLAGGQYALVVDDAQGTKTGSYFITRRRLNNPSGCGAPPSLEFGAAITSGTLASVGEADCFTLTGVGTEDRISISSAASGLSNANPGWAVVDGGGSTICESGVASTGVPCTVTGSGPWSLAVFDQGGGGTFSYSFAPRRLTSPQGCSNLGEPSTWSFSDPRQNGSIGGALGANCYTFTRGEDEADSRYWFRTVRTSGELQPRWTVYGPSGAQECSGSSGGPASACQLLAGGQYALVVDDAQGTKTGSYFITAKSLSPPAGCASVSSFGFGSPPTSGAIGVVGETDCHRLVGVALGDSMTISSAASAVQNASPGWTLLDGRGATICTSGVGSIDVQCTLTGEPGWSLVVYDEAGPGTFSYSFVVHRPDDPTGCVPLGAPAVWSFTTPRRDDTIAGTLDAKCYTFDRDPAEGDGTYWIRTLRTSGSISPQWRLYGPSGDVECQGSYSNSVDPCHLLGSGSYSLIVDDGSGGNQGGSFALMAKRTTAPSGCANVPSVAFGMPSLQGKLASGGEVDCYGVSLSAGDQLVFGLTGTADGVALLDADGDVICQGNGALCVNDADQQAIVLVYSSSGNGGNYTVTASCQNVPCGQSQTAIADAFPSHLGRNEVVSTLLRGRDLDLLDEISLSRSGQVIHGQIEEPAADGRAAEVRFDLSAAALGAWDLSATFIDGTTRLLPHAVTVEEPKPARMSIETVGREIFRPGSANSVTVEVTNEGNIDGLGVPVVIGGLPENAQIEPAFKLSDPAGSPDNPHLQDAPFDPGEDTVSEEGTRYLPLLLSRVPAGRSIRLEYKVTVPSLLTYELQVSVGQCLATELVQESEEAQASNALALAANGAADPGVNCIGGLTKEAIRSEIGDFIVPKECLRTLGNAATDLFVQAAGGNKVARPRTLFSWGLGLASCAQVLPVAKIPKIAGKAIQALSFLNRNYGRLQTIGNCITADDTSRLPQRGVTAIDPNEMLGPIGSGTQRYISGEEPLDYHVLFENLADATAPAQRIEISDHLDPAVFDPNSVLFQGVEFGGTSFSPSFGEHQIDSMLDLRPGRDLLVHVTGDVSNAGDLRFVMQAIDPETLEPPQDPDVGILPPNLVSPEGEGQIGFTVRTASLPSGAFVTNQASIRFDDNDPITTPTWSNVIDKAPPAPSITVNSSTEPLTASVSWGGTDDAAGIVQWRLEISREGGPYEVWRTAAEMGSDTFEAPAAGNYSFRAVAQDGAGNVGQSALAGLTLTAAGGNPERPGTEIGSAAGTPTAPAPAIAVHTTRLPCAKGSKKQKVHGRVRCVKKKSRHHRRHPAVAR